MSKLLALSSKNQKKSRKRVGRGDGSSHGTYSCRGMNGQSARSGGRRRPGFEGGQTPFLRKMPKLKGFKNPNYIEYQVINIGELNIFEDGAKVEKENLYEKNLISKKNKPIKLLGGKGKLEKKLTITVEKASQSAIKAVEAMKGKVEINKKEKKEESKTSKPESEPKEETPSK